MKQGLIITGGCLDMDFASSYIKSHVFDTVIAVDAGLKKALKLGLHVDAAVGDFDTLSKNLWEEYRKHTEISWDVHKPEKDETDTELAITTAMKRGCQSLVILGALGGRMDHTLGNLHLLYFCLENKVDAWIVDEKNRVSVLDQGKTFYKNSQYGKYISFLPLSFTVKGITLTGFKYPLKNKDISIGPSLCISNEITEETARLEFTEGLLICVEAKD